MNSEVKLCNYCGYELPNHEERCSEKNKTLMKKITYIAELHKFLVKESKSYMKRTDRGFYFLYYPIAYIKFIYYSIK